MRVPALLAVALISTLIAGSGVAGDGLRMRPAGVCASACPGDRTPRWSPDGSRIAFSRYDPTGKRRAQTIWAYDLRTRRQRPLLDPLAHPGVSPPYSGLVWSPEGGRLAFTNGYVRVLSADGQGRTTRVSPPTELPGQYAAFVDGPPSWSSDGRRLAFSRHGVSFKGVGLDWCCQVVAANADGSGSVATLGGPSPAEAYTSPVWSPGGGLTVVAMPRRADAPDSERAEIRTVHFESGEQRVLARVSAPGGIALLTWSADGGRLFFVRWDSLRGPAALEVVGADGLGRARLLELDAAHDQCCWISPDSTRAIVLRSGVDGSSEIHVRTLASGVERRVADGVSVQARPWLTSASWSPDGHRLAYLSDGECPTLLAVYTVTDAGRGSRRLTHGCQILGGDQRDRLRGTANPDAVYGRAGDDRLDGRAGPDVVNGGSGVDTVRGGPGDDRLYGGPGHDLLFGGEGWDALYARDGATDTVHCGPGVDAVRADRFDVVARDCERVERS